MREIKFRGFSETKHCWLYGDLLQTEINFEKKYSILDWEHVGRNTKSSEMYVKPETVGQFTGLKDKEGREIYEGDIVRTYMGNICEIRWDFVSEKTKTFDYEYTGFCFHHITQKRNYHLDITSSCEVIGNIYENPELLKD